MGVQLQAGGEVWALTSCPRPSPRAPLLHAMIRAVPLLLLGVCCARGQVETPAAPPPETQPREAVEFGATGVFPDPCTTPLLPENFTPTARSSTQEHDVQRRTIPDPGRVTAEQESLAVEKHRVLGLRAPLFAGSGEKDAAARFAKGAFGQWIRRRGLATNAIVKRYEEAQHRGQNTPSRAAALSADIAELQLEFCREFLTVAQSAMTPEVSRAAEKRQAYVKALSWAVGDRLRLAALAAEACLDMAPKDGRELVSRCTAIRTDAEAMRCPQ